MRNWDAFFEGIVTEKQIKVNEPMRRHTTFGIGGVADVFVYPKTEDELCGVLKKADAEKIPVTVVGGGSNLLVSDIGIRGITICMQRMEQELFCEGEWITARGGVATGSVSRLALKNSLKGFEWAVGIPGTICGAVFMNANGYGSDMKRVVQEVYVVSRDGKERKTYDWDELRYGDSDSIFMHTGDIVTGVKIHLGVGNEKEIKRNMEEYQMSRRTKQPLEKRSAGTVYIRPPGYHVGPMIKSCGLVGYTVGDAQVSTKHPNFVVNNGNATCEDILQILEEVQSRILEQFHIRVSLDVRMVGEGVTQKR